RGDRFLFDVARQAVLTGLGDTALIAYRQAVLQDVLDQGVAIRQVYAIAVEAIVEERKVYGGFSRTPGSVLSRSVTVLEMFVRELKRLRTIADEQVAGCASRGLTRFFAMLIRELDDDYFVAIEGHLARLRFRHGLLISAELGAGAKGAAYVLRRPWDPRHPWRQRISELAHPSHTLTIPDRDDNGFRALSELKDRGLNLVANALAESTDHILSFFALVRTEIGFYVGCLNLHDQLARQDAPICFPTATDRGQVVLSIGGLYDVCLSLIREQRVVGNDLDGDQRLLIMITGANQGGKSTFLRSLGLAHLMMACGMFVAATSFRASVCDGIFTHFTREEDVSMVSGKLDEELARMSAIAEQISPHALLLCNESFAATNEREGSQIGREIIRAMLDCQVKVCFVTHLFDLAHGFYQEDWDGALFLRAQREVDGQRSYQLVIGEPLPTSYGQDLYAHIFGTAPGAVATEASRVS
ncbi:MAG: hypothetical protein Q4P32_07600, partial [Micrococcales bacterium]|nr:hypothetical protein [Micrococcales bacterium]